MAPGTTTASTHSATVRQVAEHLRAAEIGHQTELGLGHRELRVLGRDADVARERELEAGADGVALHGGDADELRTAQPAEAGLVAGDEIEETRVTLGQLT